MDIEEYVRLVKRTIPSEALFIEALRDLMKDEIKEYLREKINKNADLKKEIREVVYAYLDAKLKEAKALTRMSKVAAELGIAILPEHMKEQFLKTMAEMVNEGIDKTLEKTL